MDWWQRGTTKVFYLLYSPFGPGEMIERVHGIDRHVPFSTISVLDRQGQELRFEGACRHPGRYVEGLGPSDAVVLEASTGSFRWADQIESKGRRASWWIRIGFAPSRTRGTR